VIIGLFNGCFQNLSGPDTTSKWRQNIVLESRGEAKLTIEDIEDAFIQFGSVDVKVLHSQKALIAASSREWYAFMYDIANLEANKF
jgi:hypothetical protein